ncbi:D-alanyl-D-alanine carboxypeptidase/D-alanyl-D-alanine-endopeptidase [Actinoalloteichus sp. AHMU CJ021]|nr:D-alanyl-D-alanine carboxypeptidase/D-alanyl-D-alanine-endopeptidase [Actinoalloteichus sp. AHMU CJ021]
MPSHRPGPPPTSTAPPTPANPDALPTVRTRVPTPAHGLPTPGGPDPLGRPTAAPDGDAATGRGGTTFMRPDPGPSAASSSSEETGDTPQAPVATAPEGVERAEESGGSPPPGGPPTEPPEDEEERPAPKGRGRLLAIGALALVVAVGTVTAFTVEPVGRFLGLRGPEVAPGPPAPPAVEPDPVLRALDLGASGPSAEGLTARLDQVGASPALGNLSGVVLDPASGETLWALDEAVPRTPASTTKLLTAAAILLTVEHDTTLETRVVQGEEPGTLVLVGGGDPTLSVLPRDTPTYNYPDAARLDDLVEQVQAATSEPVERIVVDASRYTGERLAPGVGESDVPGGHIAPVEPVMLDVDRQDPLLATTPRSSEPALAVGRALGERLGVPPDAVAVSREPVAGEGATVLGEVSSPSIERMVESMVLTSDNTLAETLARELAIATGHEPSFAGATTAILEVLAEHGLDVSTVALSDASGMSTENDISPAVLAELLAEAVGPDRPDEVAMMLRPMLPGLPVAGASGTLGGRYIDNAREGRGWVQAKTGTLTGVSTLAGIVTDVEGKLLVFALMSDGANTLEARAALDEMAAAIRTCGCR